MGDYLMEYIFSEYDKILINDVKELGGFYNAHAHLDRCNTLNKKYLKSIGINSIEGASLPLRAKQNLTGELHKCEAYTRENLKQRMKQSLEDQSKMRTTKVDTMVDVTPDLSEDGLLAVNVALELKEELKNKIKLQVGAHPIFGFKEGTGRWEVYKEAAKLCDFLGALPEKDEPVTRGRIGFKNHLKNVLLLGQELNKPVQVHVDQSNDINENHTETLINAVEWLGSPEVDNTSFPTVWAIHSISPSTYSEKRFNRMLEGLLKNNIGVICCPTAAISMRQLRPMSTPTHNSIGRILEMLEAGVRVRVGTDNICDVFVPSCDGCMLTEMKVLSNAIRFYIISVLSKLAAGKKLNNMDKEMIKRSLITDQEVFNTLI